MNILNNARHILASLAVLLFATQAQAIQITSTGQSWAVDWSVSLGSAGTLSASSTWTVNAFSSSQIVLSIDITNTTSLTGTLTNADITTFGFGIAPNATATLLTAGSVFDTVGSGSGPQQTFPGGYKQIDVCIYASGCSGGSVNSALQAGQSDSLQLLLSGNFSGGFADLIPFALKFQTNLGSYHPSGKIPEPTTIALLGFGLLLVGASRFGRTRFAATRAG